MGKAMKFTWATIIYVAAVAALYKGRINQQIPSQQQQYQAQQYQAGANVMGGHSRGTGL